MHAICVGLQNVVLEKYMDKNSNYITNKMLTYVALMAVKRFISLAAAVPFYRVS